MGGDKLDILIQHAVDPALREEVNRVLLSLNNIIEKLPMESDQQMRQTAHQLAGIAISLTKTLFTEMGVSEVLGRELLKRNFRRN